MSNSVQHSLLRIRAPRVKITYDVEVGEAIEKKELPFVVGILADIAGESASALADLRQRAFIEIDRDNFDSIIASIQPKVTVTVLDMLSKEAEKPTKRFGLVFKNFDDFDAGNIAKQIPDLANLLKIREGLVDLVAKLDGNDALIAKIAEIIGDNSKRDAILAEKDSADAPAIKSILEEVNLLKEGSNFDFLKGLILAFAQALVVSEPVTSKDSYSNIIQLISNIDKTVSDQMNEVVHDANFQKLEATWRGMSMLVHNTETGAHLKLRVLPITKEELQNDLEKAVEFDQSALFKKIYEQEYGTLGGTPYSCLIGDFYFGRGAKDIKLLRDLATLAAASHAPFLGAADPNMFDLNNFTELATPRDMTKIFESSEMAAWNSFREIEDSRYVGLLLPRTLMRLPYGQDFPSANFRFTETVDGKDNSKFCWGSPVFAMAQRITSAFAQYGWTSAIRGVEGGGKVEQLPAYTFKTSNGDVELKCPSETAITDRREKELSELGFISLCHAKGTDYCVFFGSQTTQKAKKYNTEDATANSAISARLPYLLNASRFAHYIKVIMRDKIGSFATAAEIETYLQNWIAGYVLLSDVASQEIKAEYPLREARITVIEDPSDPGAYRSVIFLRPHFQMEDLTVSLRLVAKLGG